MEGDGKYVGSRCRKVGSKLGGPVLSHCSGRIWGLLLGRHGGKTASPALECEQFEKKNTTTKCNHYDGMSYTVHFFGGNGTKMIVFFSIKLHLLHYTLLL